MRYFGLLLCIFLLPNELHAQAQVDNIPEGFMLQIMEPTGGKILRPKDWFYHEGSGETSWLWTISKEDTNGGNAGYETGMRIQAFTGVVEGTGKTPEQFVKDFFMEKKNAATKIHKVCDQSNQGLFSRTCIEVTEGDYRILYSLFWGNTIDIAVISIAGAKAEDWEANTETFDTMSEFELIDMKRFSGDDGAKAAQPAAEPSPEKKELEKGKDADEAKPDDEESTGTKE
ncbi:MAG: hypothetical protein O3C21_01695 [Verrucomicrobia bacterium]|nr:hypothetical protein [Verrucomicrobiota bacterium]